MFQASFKSLIQTQVILDTIIINFQTTFLNKVQEKIPLKVVITLKREREI